MKKLYVIFTMDVEFPGEGSKSAGFNDWHLGEKAVCGYANILLNNGFIGTFFVVPKAAERYREKLLAVEQKSNELGLHLHPEDWGYTCSLGAMTALQQTEIIKKATESWTQAIGHRPLSFRSGNCAANDHTFGVLESLGFAQGSLSMPERNMISLGSVWTSAPKDPHFTNSSNRLLAGDMNFLEVPMTVDWESMIWAGKQPVDLRIENCDARAHGFTIEKCIKRMIDEDVFPKTLVPITHNYFDYSSDIEFRAIVLKGVIEKIKFFADKHSLEIEPTTLAGLKQIMTEEKK